MAASSGTRGCGLDSVVVHLTMLIGIPMAGSVGVIVTTLFIYQRWSAQTSRAAAGQVWAARCVDPRRPKAWRTLCLENDGVVLRGIRHKVVAQWQWSQIVEAVEGPVRPFEALISHNGLILHLADGHTMSFLFPSRSAMRYPAERLDEALNQVRRRLERPRPPSGPATEVAD
jgi:hypothetical protein